MARLERTVLCCSDVYAQFLRVQMLADRAGAVSIDHPAAFETAETLASFQLVDGDRHSCGGFCFALQSRKGGSRM